MQKPKFNKLYDYPKSIRSLINDERHYDVGDMKLPSVTTILSATQSEDKKASLAKWRAKVGNEEAEKVRKNSTDRGTRMHSILEGYLLDKPVLDATENGAEAHRMAQAIIDQGLGDLSEINGLEACLYYPDLYAGSSDLVGIYQGRDSIIDFKTTSRPRMDEWNTDYYLQGVAYLEAHNQVYGSELDQVVLLCVTPDCFVQKFLLNGARLRQYKWEWLKRLDEFYKNRNA
jgi:ATP-dependent exoDNAse (exonuclease V) beta subunit